MSMEGIIYELSRMPIHSSEWLDNPSVRVDLRRIVVECREQFRESKSQVPVEVTLREALLNLVTALENDPDAHYDNAIFNEAKDVLSIRKSEVAA